MKTILKAKQIYAESGIIENGAVSIEDERIARLDGTGGGEALDFGDAMLFPGLIDIHVHGGGGFDVMDATAEAVCGMARYKATEGVTAFCPTTVTTSLDKTKEAIRAVKTAHAINADGARLLGTFCEGPYINEAYKGAHPPEFIREVNLDELANLLEAGDGSIGSFAVAPEKENADKLITFLAARGVQTRIGHSAATYAEAQKAIALGANIFIHTFNAMSPIGHREVGMAGTALIDDRAFCELICDFIHVAPEAARLVYKSKGADKIILITDAMKAAGLPDGMYKLGELDVVVKDGICRTLSGALASSTVRMIDAVRNMTTLGIPLEECLCMATANPAKAIGIFKETGSIAVGKLADFTVVDDDFRILFVMSNGRILIDNRK